MSYCPRKGKTVVLLSTMHAAPEISLGLKMKPQMILDYNRTKAGVDTMDQMARCYTTKRQSRRWPMAMFFNMLDITCLNSFVLYTSSNSSWEAKKRHRRRLYLVKLGEKLVAPQKEKNIRESARKQRIGKKVQGRCRDCPRSSDKKFMINCITCAKFLCLEHRRVVCNNCSN